MKQKTKQLIMTLVALLAVTTGAWAQDASTVFELSGSTASVGTLVLGTSSVTPTQVKIHSGHDNIDCIKLGGTYSYANGKYFTIAPASGSFKKGDKVSIAVCCNHDYTSETVAKAVIYAADGSTLLYTTSQGINGNNSASDPVVEEFELTQDAEKLYIGRLGKQGDAEPVSTYVTTLKVTGARADEVKYPIVYDFEAAANASENPSNKNGSAANGQAFYGWENAEKTDNKRQDYKGYEYAEGSKLPEVCHVWRRSDHINGNVAGNGGLKCPSNKEMAVDGLTAGMTVTIIYDATNATNKEIVWAIGDGSSESLGEPRAKATINGAEAVPGTTTIKSGDVITVTKVTPAENGSGYIVFGVKKGMVIKKIIVDVAPVPTPVPLTRGTGEKINEWTLTNGMPAGNVTVSVEYYPQAAFAMSTDATPVALAPKASTSARANTDDPLVEGGTVAGIVDDEALLEEGQGTLLYHFSATQLDAAALEALTATDWTDKVPTADGLAEGTVYVYCYIMGADDLPGITSGAKFTFSDSDIQELAVTLLPEPTYDVTLNADGLSTDEAAAWKVAKGTDDPAAFPLEGVKKGETVTVTYSGERKVIGVKAEKAKPITIGGQEYTVLNGETWKQFITRNQLSGWSVGQKTDTTWIVNMKDPFSTLNVSSDGTTWNLLVLNSEDAPIDTDKQYKWDD